LVGINLLREGLDIPEVSLVAIFDADKEGFLRSETSLIQTCGRAARNQNGEVIMYADFVTPSMQRAIEETERRRSIQDTFNKEHGIVPETVKKSVRDVLMISTPEDSSSQRKRSKKEKERLIIEMTKEMKYAASMLEFEYAAKLRDKIKALKEEL
jgi:excinuclease ABC subunit B